MKKISILIILSLFIYLESFALIEKNKYNDIGLNEKNGIYGYDVYLRKSYIMFFSGVGLPNDYNAEDDSRKQYTEIGGRLKTYIELGELQGFYFLGDFFISRNSRAIYKSGDLAWWSSFVPYFGETHMGYNSKYFNIKLGFQRLTSSDAIYNHLMVDDYSGSFCALRVTTMFSRYLDAELIYSIIRPHQGPWYQGDRTIDIPDNVDDKTLYDAYYGKSLYMHKLNVRPLPWIRFGVYEGSFFLGENLNQYYANPFFIYIASQLLSSNIEKKDGSRYTTHAANLVAGVDFNIGFNGWRVYGEFYLDDFNGEYIKFADGSHPDKFGFILGGELRGYIFTKYYRFSPLGAFILKNLYFNIEYAIVSKYCYSRDSNFNYEYVRSEYPARYDYVIPDDKSDRSKFLINRRKTTNRVGNFLGYMYGPNSDSLDFAVGWRSDLYNVKEYNADYQGDVFFYNLKKKKYPDRLFKMQLHFRQYRLGDERDVVMPYYYGEHPSYYLETGEKKRPAGTSRGTEFIKNVVELGDIVDFNIYTDIVKINRFVLGMETKFLFKWTTYFPFTDSSETEFDFRWDYGIICSW